MWTIAVCTPVAGTVIGILMFFTHFYHNEDLGKELFGDSEKPLDKKAPEMYYHKQRMLRLCYGFFIGVNCLLVVISIGFTSVIIYVVVDDKLDLYIRIFISVMAATITALQTILRFDKVGEGYICAMRAIEQAVLGRENRESTTLNVLNELPRSKLRGVKSPF